MSYGLAEYAGALYGGSLHGDEPSSTDTRTALSVEVAFTTGALETPVWVDITEDVRFWDVQRGRSRELERFQPGRATIVLANLSRQYDSVYADGPHFGDIRPMRRIRIRETFNGVTYPVFDGFVDRWELDYPAVGKDATATLTATDAFKVLARTELPVSVYYDTVLADAPALWWRFDDPQYEFTAVDSSGNNLPGTPQGDVRFGGETLIVNDPGSALELRVAGDTNVERAYSLDGASPFSFEFWVKLDVQTTGARLIHFTSGGSAAVTFSVSVANFRGTFQIINDAAGGFSTTTNLPTFVQGNRYHVVCTQDSARLMHIYINGVEASYTAQQTTTGATTITGVAVGTSDTTVCASGLVDEFALYTTALSAAQVAAHYAAGSAPWQGDDADDRLNRILDLADWPSALRELDDGSTTFQSAELGTTVLEHAHKCAETEFGLLAVNRAGVVRFVSRASQGARSPGPTVYGDGAGEVGYRSIRPDDGDEVIRNSATISRLNGVAKTATGATIDEFGRFQYTLDGLLHDTDSYSSTYAQFIVDEYENPRRRIVELTIGPPPDGDEGLYYPAMLGPELGDAISVTHTPQGLGNPLEQTCIVEGVSHSSSPGRNRTTTFILSPEFTETLF